MSKIEQLEKENKELRADIEAALSYYETLNLFTGKNATIASLPRLIQKAMRNPDKLTKGSEIIEKLKLKYG